MSAVVGLLLRDGRPAAREDLARMLGSMAYRGPDGAGVWASGPAGLGHGALWTTPEAVTERLPLESDQLVVSADLRLDNRDDLLAVLGLRDQPGLGDGALVARAYERWGEACPEHLLGDFAFAVWDGRRQSLFCARDSLGAKPLCYVLTDRLFAVASDPRALLTLPEVPKRIDEGRIADYLIGYTEDIDHASTFFEGLHKLPPAQSLAVSPREVRRRTYWSLADAPDVRLGSDAAYVEAFQEVFTEAVRCRLRSAGPVGSALSGGIDSSAIVGVASALLEDQGRGPLRTYSGITPGDHACRETRAVRAVIAATPLEATLFSPADLDAYAEGLEEIVQASDDLFDLTMVELRYLTYRVARAQGVNVVLDGVDGDLVLGSGLPFIHGLGLGQWRRGVQEARAFHQVYSPQGSTPALLWRHGLQAAVAEAVPAPVRDLRRRLASGRRLKEMLAGSLIRPEFARRVDLAKRLARRGLGGPTGAATVREQHAWAIQRPMLTVGVERYERVAARQGVEARHPLLDRRVVELAVGLPPELRRRRGQTKWILRQAVRGTLPETVRQRPSWDALLGWTYVQAWAAKEKDLLRHALFDGVDRIEPYVDVPAARRAFAEWDHQRGDVGGLWEAVTLAYWPPLSSGSFRFP